jgi:[ribosomal protein S18]-alanine N-acetyltransferase
MVGTDIETVARIERQAFPTNWTTQAWVNELSNPYALYLVADSGNNSQILGHVGCHVILDEAHITTLAVVESQRGKKIGERLLLSLIEAAQKQGATQITLEVRSSNLAAKALYAKYGFAFEGVRRGYYSDTNEDGEILWVRDLSLPSWRALFEKNKHALGLHLSKEFV